MKLIYDDKNEDHLSIYNRMTQMVLAFEKEIRNGKNELVLIDGEKSYLGKEQVNAYLDEVAGDLHNWHYGTC